jgi:hypothetical protein
MAEKKSFLLRIDTEKFEALEKWAADEFRSVNGQVEWLIHQALKNAGRMPSSNKNQTNSKEKKDKPNT